ncbi:syntaxin-3-like [Erythrolamprus reginae]|uniref:syntaxin-3-like n=1 Tax=Erythrolamprus reginae TaxID=121349 RepID=UPI00396C9267
MKDRLEELRRRRYENGDSLELEENFSFDNPVFQEDENSAVSKVLQEITSLSLALEKLGQSSENIAKKQQQVLCCTTEVSIGEEKKELSTMKDIFTKEAKALQPRLNDIRETLAKDRPKSLAISRIRYSQFSVLVSRYREIVTRHYVKETHYVEKLKEQIQRQSELAGLHLQEEDIKKLVESPTMPRIVGQDLEVLKAKQHLAMAQVRHQQLLDLEAQIGELHSLFLHLEILVLEQQEVLDSIEYNILHTTDYISQSNEEVKKAIKYQRHSRLSTLLSALLGLCACCTCLSCMATPNVLR